MDLAGWAQRLFSSNSTLQTKPAPQRLSGRRWVGAACAVAALGLIVGQAMSVQAQERRFPLDPWVEPTPGVFFTFMDDLGNQTGWLQDCLKLLEVIDPNGKRFLPVKALNVDLLSRKIAIAREGYASHLLSLKAVFAVHGPKLGPEQFRQAMAVVVFPDDTVQSTDTSQALRLTYAILSRLDRELRTRSYRRDLAGSYRVSVRGGCPVAAGVIEIRQQGPYLEGAQPDSTS